MFDGVKVEVKKKGKAVTISKKVIRDPDMQLIVEYFSYSHRMNPDPKLLQECVIFNIIYFFCYRGQENLHKMIKEHFKVFTDESGIKYVAQNINEMDKNHREDGQSNTNEGRMYATGEYKICSPLSKFWIATPTPHLQNKHLRMDVLSQHLNSTLQQTATDCGKKQRKK